MHSARKLTKTKCQSVKLLREHGTRRNLLFRCFRSRHVVELEYHPGEDLNGIRIDSELGAYLPRGALSTEKSRKTRGDTMSGGGSWRRKGKRVRRVAPRLRVRGCETSSASTILSPLSHSSDGRTALWALPLPRTTTGPGRSPTHAQSVCVGYASFSLTSIFSF